MIINCPYFTSSSIFLFCTTAFVFFKTLIFSPTYFSASFSPLCISEMALFVLPIIFMSYAYCIRNIDL